MFVPTHLCTVAAPSPPGAVLTIHFLCVPCHFPSPVSSLPYSSPAPAAAAAPICPVPPLPAGLPPPAPLLAPAPCCAALRLSFFSPSFFQPVLHLMLPIAAVCLYLAFHSARCMPLTPCIRGTGGAASPAPCFLPGSMLYRHFISSPSLLAPVQPVASVPLPAPMHTRFPTTRARTFHSFSGPLNFSRPPALRHKGHPPLLRRDAANLPSSTSANLACCTRCARLPIFSQRTAHVMQTKASGASSSTACGTLLIKDHAALPQRLGRGAARCGGGS